MKKLLSLMAIFVISLLSVSMVSAQYAPGELDVLEVEINHIEATTLTQADVETLQTANQDGIDFTGAVVVEEGENLEIEVLIESRTDARDIEVSAELRGYEYGDYEDLTDRSHLFDLNGYGVNGAAQKKVRLNIDLPNRLEDDRYFLRIDVEDRASARITYYVALQVEPTRHGIEIADVVFSPGNTIQAGRALLTSVLLENYGDKEQDDVKVSVEIPELGLIATEVVDEVETDRDPSTGGSNVDYEDVPELYLGIPATAQAGEYAVKVSARYDDLREVVTKTYTIRVADNPLYGSSSDKLILAVGPESQAVAAGQTARYGVALTNEGRTSKAYTISAVTGDWANAQVAEKLVVLEAGKSKVVDINVDVANNAVAGTHAVSVAVASGNEVLQTVTLNADVVAGSNNVDLRNGLEIALIVLVVLLVIIGLIVGFSRLRRSEDDETYY